MSLYVRGEKDKVKDLRKLAETMGLDVILYSDIPVSEIGNMENLSKLEMITSNKGEPLTPSTKRTLEATNTLYKQNKRGVTPQEIAKETGISRNMASCYLNRAFKDGLVNKITNTDKSVNARYLFKPTGG
tara:strand:+ start:715 stop:1104 length:390 start_codon:yes stop_codon:yes gene_type:complete